MLAPQPNALRAGSLCSKSTSQIRLKFKATRLQRYPSITIAAIASTLELFASQRSTISPVVDQKYLRFLATAKTQKKDLTQTIFRLLESVESKTLHLMRSSESTTVDAPTRLATNSARLIFLLRLSIAQERLKILASAIRQQRKTIKTATQA